MNPQTGKRFNDPNPRVIAMRYYLDHARNIIEGWDLPNLDGIYRKPMRKLPVSANDTSSADGAGQGAQTAGDDGDDGDGDGDGDPDSDRTCPPAPSTSPQYRPLPQAPATLPRSLPPQQQYPELPRPPTSPKRSRRAPSRIHHDDQPERWRYDTRGQWFAFVLIIILLAKSGVFALFDKDWLAWGVLTTTIPWIIHGFGRPSRN